MDSSKKRRKLNKSKLRLLNKLDAKIIDSKVKKIYKSLLHDYIIWLRKYEK